MKYTKDDLKKTLKKSRPVGTPSASCAWLHDVPGLSIDTQPYLRHLALSDFGSDPSGRPARSDVGDSSEASLVLSHDDHRPLVFGISSLHNLLYEFREVPMKVFPAQPGICRLGLSRVGDSRGQTSNG